ncbi:hypothetical protein LLG96_02070 [bacterium]|nr:hypothetical protein [bacterium]
MPNINDINTAVYRLLNTDAELAGLCTVYKGGKRPVRAVNPSATIEAKRLEPGEGEGIWMCDILVTVYTDILANGMHDCENLETISSRIRGVLSDAEVEMDGTKALPLIEGSTGSPDWSKAHESETFQECIFGLVFIKY